MVFITGAWTTLLLPAILTLPVALWYLWSMNVCGLQFNLSRVKYLCCIVTNRFLVVPVFWSDDVSWLEWAQVLDQPVLSAKTITLCLYDGATECRSFQPVASHHLWAEFNLYKDESNFKALFQRLINQFWGKNSLNIRKIHYLGGDWKVEQM